MKKLFLFIPLLFLLFSCGNNENIIEETNMIEIDGMLNSHGKESNIKTNISLNKLIEYDNQNYYSDLNRLGIVLSSICRNRFLINDELYSIEDVFKELEFDTLFGENINYNIDTNDTNYKLFAYKEIEYKNSNYDIYFLVNEGSSDKLRSWKSDFDIGYDGESYYEIIGDTEWKNKNNHKGIDVTSNRIYDEFLDFVDKNNNNNEKIVFNTGHSRGGAIANIIGAYLEDNDLFKSFTYTYATFNLTKDENNKKTIFNIINENDLIANSMPESFNFKRYGTDIYFKSEDYKDIVEELINTDYYPLGTKELIELLHSFCDEQENLYKIDYYHKVLGIYDDDKIDLVIQKIDNLLDDYTKKLCRYYKTDNNEVIFESAPIFILYYGDLAFNSSNQLAFIMNSKNLIPLDIDSLFNSLDLTPFYSLVDNHNYYTYYAYALEN